MENEKNSKTRVTEEFMNEEQMWTLKNQLLKIIGEIRENRQENTGCYLCKNEIKNKDFAKSHSIPKFILKYIATENEWKKDYYEVKTRYNEQNLKDQSKVETIKKAERFRNICRNCESILFKNYEKFLEDYEKFLNDENKNIPNDNILSEINLKIYLKETYELKKSIFEDSELNILIEKIREDDVIRKIDNLEINRDIMLKLNNLQKKKWNYLKEKLDKTVEQNLKICIQNIEIENNSKDKKTLSYLEKRKKVLEKYERKDINYNDFSYKCHIINLNYRVPLAIQSLLDLQEIITIMEALDTYKITEFIEDRESFIPVSICIFPLENTTRIFLFSENENRAFNIFKQKFEKIEQEIQLKFINYMILVTTNTYCYSPLLDHLIEDKIEKIIMNEDVRMLTIDKSKIKAEIEEIPNLLSEKYSIENLKK